MAVRERSVFWLALAALRAGGLIGRLGAWLQKMARRWLGWVACRLALRRGSVTAAVPAVVAGQPALEPPLDPILLATWLWGAGNARPDSGLDLRIGEDISGQHRKRILAGWSGLLAGGRLAGFQRRQLGAVADAAERWLREAALIEAETLRVLRFYAIAHV